ncbi:efflux RND transporter permease subunit [Planctomonas psychrotolerans]|uniref:efflux RND transporter permease subunit n=1 Tax=Planctomonas psychrotolerans TaxID=2528712 RepID=UPI0012395F21|nr:efflux RND transporter permease subunit [Planctomonas psychrotolerans]
MHLLAVFSLRNRALIALVTVVIAIFGGLALNSLKQELIPSVSFPRLVVVTAYPGAAPEVVNDDVSTPIETAMQAVPGLEDTTATSTTNVSTVSASFAFGTDLATAEQKVQQAINRISSQLPTDIDPQVITGTIDDLPVLQVAVTSDLDQRELTTALEGAVLADIQALEGVREASLLGTLGQRVVITPDPAALAAAGLSTGSIRDALDANGVLLPAGEITENGSTLSVQTGSRTRSIDDIAGIPLLAADGAGADSTPGDSTPGGAAPGGAVPTIGSVATVELDDDPVTGISRVNGQPSLTIAVTKTPDGNTVDVSHVVQELLPTLASDIGSNTEFTVVFDQAPFIEQSIESLTTEGLLGLVFAVIVILVFLMSLRSTLVTAISIPASVLITFIGLQASNYTLNILTLGALTISIGRVVDDSIVVIENIKRHLSFTPDRMIAITQAVREVAGAITASTVTTVAVFLPLALVGDVTGELFRPFALTVTIALVASLFVALTIVPVLAYWFLRPSRTRAPRGGTDALAELEAATAGAATTSASSTAVAAAHPRTRRQALSQDDAEDELDTPTRLQRGYLPVISWTLRRPVATILIALLVLGGTVALIPSMKTNFLSDSGQNTLTVSQELPTGTSLEAQDVAASAVEDALLEVDGVETVQLSIGSDGGFLSSAFGRGGAVTFSITTDADVDQEQLRADVRTSVRGLDEVGEVTVAAAGSGFSSSDIEVNITANGQSELNEAAEAVLAEMRDLDVVAEASSNLSETRPYIAVQVDRTAAAAAGLSEIVVGGIVAEARLPAAVGSVVIDENTLSIYIANANAPTTLDELRSFSIPTPAGVVPLTDLATVDVVDGPANITTTQGFRSATISVTPNSDDIGTASAVVQEAVDAIDLPGGASAQLGGVTSQQGDAFEQLGIALLVAILIVYIVMVATFRSLRQPLLLLVSVPFAATGAIALQVVSGIPLGVASLIGVLMLIGIVVTNAIVLVDLINQYRNRGMRVGDAIVHGASRRLRPILMTALATIFALVPLAIGLTGSGGFISQPLAIVVIGGLVSSTLLTLVVLPVLYYLVEGYGERRAEGQPSMVRRLARRVWAVVRRPARRLRSVVRGLRRSQG